MARLLVVGLTAGVLVAPGVDSVAAAAPVSCVDEAASEAAALAVAAACGRAVAVGPSRSEFVQVLAEPDGRLVLESAVVPQRTRRADGHWADVDLRLSRGGDGLLRPAASVADVAFSGGGDAPLVTLRRAGRTLTLSWPGSLPVPAVSGEAATYADVLPGADLVVRATDTGFSHVLVVKTPAAAADPAVRQVRFRLGGDVQVRSLPDGSLRVVAGSTLVASAPPALMWDSSRPGRQPVAGADPGLAVSSAASAGDGARTAAVATVLGDDGTLRLVADAALLDSPDVTLPVYVDPAWSVAQYRWAYATNTGCTNSDVSRARVGKSPEGKCSGDLYRSFFQFATSALAGTYVYAARVQTTLYHSYSCNATWVNLYQSGLIDHAYNATWSKMTLKTWMSSAEAHAHKPSGGAGCADDPQPDVQVNFTGSRIRTQLQAAATGRASTFTVGLSARDSDGTDESTQARWKKFYPASVKLVVDFDHKPTAPSSLQVAGVACPSSGVLTVGTLTPTLSAIYHDADTGQTLTGTFEWVQVPSGGVGAITDTSPARQPAPSRPQATANNRATTAALSGLAKGKTYAFRVRATDPAPYNITSPWSGWCQFAVDTTKPPVTVTVVSVPPGPGKAGTFRIESTATDVTTFKYGWGAATKAVAATGTSPKSATIEATASKYGLNILNVSAVDTTLNEGVGSVEFTVARPSPPVARWGLETYPGVDQVAAVADQQPGLAGDTPLTTSDVSWTEDARLVGGRTLTFDGASSQAVQAVATGLDVDTTESFSVAAWVRLRSVDGYQTFVSKDIGSDEWGPFRLQIVDGRWRFQMLTSLTTQAGAEVLWGPSTGEAERWTHVAASYDKAEGKMHLWVDGTHYEKAFASPVNASGSIVLGYTRNGSRNGGDPVSLIHGDLADVQVFDRVLVDQDFTGQLASDPESGGFDEPGILSPIEVGSWDFEAATSCYVADLADTCEAPPSGPWDRWLALTRGAEAGAGHLGNDLGLWLDDQYFPDEGYTESSEEYGSSAYKTGTTPPDDDGNEYTIWQETPVLKTDQSFTLSAWVVLDRLDGEHRYIVSQRGAHRCAGWLKYNPDLGKWEFAITAADDAASAVRGVASTSPAEAGVWTHLVGVYDSRTQQMRIYVNGDLEDVGYPEMPPFASSGPLLVGGWVQWTGGIDDVRVFQGAMTDAQVLALYDSETG